MKSIEQLTKLSEKDLERISMDESIEVPKGVRQSAENAVLAASAIEQEKRHGHGRLTFALSLVAAALAIVFVVASPRQPKDTFTDPEQAYAELEKTLAYISEKSSKGLDLARQGDTIIDKTLETIR